MAQLDLVSEHTSRVTEIIGTSPDGSDMANRHGPEHLIIVGPDERVEDGLHRLCAWLSCVWSAMNCAGPSAGGVGPSRATVRDSRQTSRLCSCSA
jgi:hypothetical protein